MNRGEITQMKRLSLFACAALAFALAACGGITSLGNKVSGSGNAKSEKRELGPFTAVEVKCAATVNVNSQGSRSVEIRSDDNIVPLITTEVKNNTLYISSTKEYSPRNKMQIDISTPDLTRFVFAGAGDVDISNIKNDRLEIVVSGAGSLNAAGETKEADITLSGAGSVNARSLLAQKAKAVSTGVGTIDVFAALQLDASTSGVGDINYYGNPKSVSKQANGVGSISQK